MAVKVIETPPMTDEQVAAIRARSKARRENPDRLLGDEISFTTEDEAILDRIWDSYAQEDNKAKSEQKSQDSEK
ncbi:MAG: hypothetical protein M5R41_10505 [Bacteroidia bacterium]|nr:hypothetical protein [Bacteroidia bacterium]